MVVDRHGELFLGGVLADHVLVQVFFQFQRFRKLVLCPVRLIVPIVLQDRIAYGDAFVANVSSGIVVGGGDQLPDYVLTLVTKTTSQSVIGTCTFQWNLR
jgi:hypothetical protein